MKAVQTIALCFVVLVLIAIAFVWSGMYDISATTPHWGITSHIIEIVRERSIDVRSDKIQVPNLNDAKYLKSAISHYHGMCRLCHGAPGYDPEEFVEGLYPVPPSMISGEIQGEMGNAEIYWIAKNGIKLTGMPAFGPTHSEEQLWGMVALAEKLPSLNADGYRKLLENTDVHRHMEKNDHDAGEDQKGHMQDHGNQMEEDSHGEHPH
jgi:hypothetical protein